MEIVGLDKAIQTITFEEIPGDMEDRIVEENIEMIGVINTVEVKIGQEKGYLLDIMVLIETEVPATVGQGQDLELVQIEIG